MSSSIASFRSDPDFVKIVEVGPRDGLQNEPLKVPTTTKVELINRLSASGLSVVEVTSFVSPKWIPQMADNSEVLSSIHKSPNVSYPVLVPNIKGLESAIESGAKEIAVFSAASEAFCKRNINCTVKESLARFKPVINTALEHNLKIRGYVSTVLGCPYQGEVDPQSVADLTKALLDMGCYEISLGDTIGIGTPGSTRTLLETLGNQSEPIDFSNLAVHFHDTYGQALANIACSVKEFGIRVVDSSVAGLGGCPYARGASGNVATEDVVYMLEGMGMKTGVDMKQLVSTGRFISQMLGRDTSSKAGKALESKWMREAEVAEEKRLKESA
eukprot:g2862.t1